jgi:hypothetical protein
MRLSARNQIPARITAIHNGEAISNVELDAGGTRWWPRSPWRRSSNSACQSVQRSPRWSRRPTSSWPPTDRHRLTATD